MEKDTRELLEDLLAAQAVTLAKVIEIEKKMSKESSFGGYYRKATELITEKKDEVLKLLGLR